MKFSRLILDMAPFENPAQEHRVSSRGHWPAYWIHSSNTGQTPIIAIYELEFNIDAHADMIVHITADERYELFIDEHFIGRGPERGDVYNCFFESFKLSLESGAHKIAVRVWSLGEFAPLAQMSLKHGLLVAAEPPCTELINTGIALWKTKLLDGYSFIFNEESWGAGASVSIDGCKVDWKLDKNDDDSWQTALKGMPGVNASSTTDCTVRDHLLRPAMLPPMLSKNCCLGKVRYIDEPETDETWHYLVADISCKKDDIPLWNKLLEGKQVVSVLPFKRQRIIVDLEDYYCAYPSITISGGTGAIVRIHWAESLYENSCTEQINNPKGHRNSIENKYFVGTGDVFKSDGGTGRKYKPLWWRAGRYIEIFIETADEKLFIEDITFEETRYPLQMESSFECDDSRIAELLPIMLRSMQMCAHETFIDCPYYEQLMYVGDSRLTSLTGYCMSLDSSLQRKAIDMFNISRLPSGLTRPQYPSRLMQIIAPFSLWWIAMVHDYAMWRGDKEFIRQQMSGIRGVIEAFLQYIDNVNLIVSPTGWNFVDWVPEWELGVPPGGKNGISGVINWQFVYILTIVKKLEKWLGEHELAERADRLANNIAASLKERFWDENRGMLSDDLDKQNFSEHTQCMALLSGKLDRRMCRQVSNSLFAAKGLAQTTIYFSHYYFEACRLAGRSDKLFERLKLWFDLESQGFKTTFETPGNTRSDCHAWGAHPIYHCFATILGVRPETFGFDSIELNPMLGPICHIKGTLVHPKGEINIDLECSKQLSLTGTVSLPSDIGGVITWRKKSSTLQPGKQEICF